MGTLLDFKELLLLGPKHKARWDKADFNFKPQPQNDQQEVEYFKINPHFLWSADLVF